MEELLDVIDETDTVIGQATRAAVHAQGLWHRGAHVFLFDNAGRLLVQKRSSRRAQYPSLWDGSVSEHVKAGETYLDAARRGAREELGVSGLDLERAATFRMVYGPRDNEVSALFLGRVEAAQVTFDPQEIQSVAFVSAEELLARMKNRPQEFCGWFVEILRWLRGEPSKLIVLREAARFARGRKKPGEAAPAQGLSRAKSKDQAGRRRGRR